MSIETGTTPDLILKPEFLWGGPRDWILNQDAPSLASSPSFPTSSLFPPNQNKDEFWMLQAFKTALRGVGIPNPNPAVGCLLVNPQNQIISSGFTQRYKGWHAERVALAKVSDWTTLSNATAYITLEPCSHSGHQPPCLDFLLETPIQKFVIGQTDPFSKVSGNSIERLRKAGRQVKVGFWQNELTAWNAPFFYDVLQPETEKKIFVALKWAQTLDGQLADDQNSSQWISGPQSRRYTHWLRQRYDLLLIGAQTLIQDQPSLTARDCLFPQQADPFVLIWDPKGRCLATDPKTQEAIRKKIDQASRGVLYLTDKKWVSEFQTLSLLRHHRGPARVCGLDFSTHPAFPVKTLMEFLHSEEMQSLLGRKVQSLMVEGGAKTHSQFLKEGVANLLHVFTAPKITAGRKNRLQLGHPLALAQSFTPAQITSLGSDSLMELISKETSSILFSRQNPSR